MNTGDKAEIIDLTDRLATSFLEGVDSYLLDEYVISPDSTRAALIKPYEYRVLIWDVLTGKLLGEYRDHNSHISGLAFSPDGRQFATSSADGTIVIRVTP